MRKSFCAACFAAFACIVPAKAFGGYEANAGLALIPELRLEYVTNNHGKLGEDLNVSLHGRGFSRDTRVSIAPNCANRMQIKESFSTPGTPWAVAVSGRRLYAADGEKGLLVVDMDDPDYSVSIDMSGIARDVVIVEDKRENKVLAFVAADAAGLEIVDVSDPARPQWVNRIDTPGKAGKIALAGGFAFVAADSSGLQIIDVRDPAAGRLIKEVSTPEPARDVAVAGEKAYVAAGAAGVWIIDIGIPAEAQTIQGVDTPGFALGVAAVKGLVYVADDGAGMHIIDATDPMLAAIIDTVNLPGKAKSVTTAGGFAYVAADASGLQIIDVRDMAPAVIASSVETPGGWASDVTASSGIVYVADKGSGIHLVDVGDINPPALVGVHDTPGFARGLTVVDQKAYVASDIGGLHIIDVGDPRHPSPAGSLFLPGNAYNVSVDEGIAYVAADDGGLHIVDVGSPAQPVLMSTMDTPGRARDLYVENGTAYVADGDQGLRIIDVRDPAHPSVIKDLGLPGDAREVVLRNNLAYIASYDAGLRIVDVTDPARPEVVLSDGRFLANGLTVIDDLVFVADARTGLHIVKISLPYQASIIGSVELPPLTFGVTVTGNTAYLAGDYGVYKIDVSDPFNPLIIGSVSTSETALASSVIGDTAYVAAGLAGLILFQTPLEISPVDIVGDRDMRVTIPSPLAPGNYNLRVFDGRQSDELPLAVTFSPRVKKSKAIIIAGKGDGPNVPDLSKEFLENANFAYNTLLWQGYPREDIFYLNHGQDADADHDGKTDARGDVTAETMYHVLHKWVMCQDLLHFPAYDHSVPCSPAEDLVVYMVGHGTDGSVTLKKHPSGYWFLDETLPAWFLALLLDDLQAGTGVPAMTGRLIVIYDACNSGSFIEPLAPPPNAGVNRIVITGSSADEVSYFLGADNERFHFPYPEGQLSFAYQFWSRIRSTHGSVAQSFDFASQAMSLFQTPLLDATADGNPDGGVEHIENIIIKRGVPDPRLPALNRFAPRRALSGETSAQLWATVHSIYPISRVWAEIIPPGLHRDLLGFLSTRPAVVELAYSPENSRYEGSHDGFNVFGTFQVHYYAENDRGYISLPAQGMILQASGPDIYENDNSAERARVIVLNDGAPREHTFHAADDEDWITFYGIAGQFYAIEADILFNEEKRTDVVIELYGPDGSTILRRQDGDSPYADERLNWICGADGIYYVRFWNKLEFSGASTRYDVTVKRPIAPELGTLTGFVKDAETGAPLEKGMLKTDQGASAQSDAFGRYTLKDMPANVKLTVTAGGHEPLCNHPVTIVEAKTVTLDIHLRPGRPTTFAGSFGKTAAQGLVRGDYDCDGDADGMDLVTLSRSFQ